MDEKMRAEFEAWWREENGNRLYCESAWRGWQASRAALVVELPDDGLEDCFREWRDSCRDDFDTGYCYATDRIVAAIESAGVRVKP